MALQYAPAGHVVGSDAPSGQYEPAGQSADGLDKPVPLQYELGRSE